MVKVELSKAKDYILSGDSMFYITDSDGISVYKYRVIKDIRHKNAYRVYLSAKGRIGFEYYASLIKMDDVFNLVKCKKLNSMIYTDSAATMLLRVLKPTKEDKERYFLMYF